MDYLLKNWMSSPCFKILIFQKILFLEKNKILYLPPQNYTVVVVQPVRTSDCGSEGRGFESHHPPIKQSLEIFRAFLFLSNESDGHNSCRRKKLQNGS